ncbi:MAG: hemerythrin domain-containing protein [Rhodothermales bacterium]
MSALNKARKGNPVDRQDEDRATRQAFSPMDLTETFAIPSEDALPYEVLHPLLQGFVDEHERVVEELERFEAVLTGIKEHGVGEEASRELARFFRFFDEHVVPHNRREEKQLFDELRERLLAEGAHSRMEPATTSVDVLESDHTELLQIAAVSFNLFGLGGRLPEPASRAITFDAAVEQGLALVEHLRLHIYREDNVVFPLVQKHFDESELDALHAAELQHSGTPSA